MTNTYITASKAVAFLAIVSAAILLSACDQTPRTTAVYSREDGTMSRKLLAMDKGSALLVTVPLPPPGMSQGDAARAVADALSDAHNPNERFTVDPDSAAKPHIRLAFAFEAQRDRSGITLCQGDDIAHDTPGKDSYMIAAFCSGKERLAEVDGWLSPGTKPGDAEFAKIVTALKKGLFTTGNDRK